MTGATDCVYLPNRWQRRSSGRLELCEVQKGAGTDMSKILIIEDDREMQFVLSDNLQAEGHETVAATTGAAGLQQWKAGDVDLILLDLMLPDASGIEICKQIRTQDGDTPIIMLTAKTDEIDKVVGLEVGADDYVTKPFGVRELLARVKAMLRRSARSSAQPMQECTLGDVVVDFARRELRRGRHTEKLTRYESDLLRFLAENRGESMSREKILEEVWGAELSAGNRTVDNYIARLRAKIETSPSHPRHILTVHGAGYRLV